MHQGTLLVRCFSVKLSFPNIAFQLETTFWFAGTMDAYHQVIEAEGEAGSYCTRKRPPMESNLTNDMKLVLPGLPRYVFFSVSDLYT